MEFAELGGKREITLEDWKDWIGRWGALGFGEVGFCGGPGETFGRFVEEARQANKALRLYETAADDPALLELGLLVKGKLVRHAYLTPYRAGDRWVLSHEFKDLLGALWLQMAWLMVASPDAAKLCEWCNRPVAIPVPEETPQERDVRRAAGIPKPRKTPKHRKYCSANCRATAHQHRTKARKHG